MTVRVRFAPNPSGSIHVGNARTVLYNWLFARHHGGKFILRIEDTDPARVREEHYQTLQDDLLWLGLDWDEGPGVGGPHEPYLQSQRTDLYREAIDRLSEAELLYRCYCTGEELAARRKEAMAEGRPPIYDRRCFRLTERERADFEAEAKPWALRIKVPDEGATTFHDLVVGDVTFEHRALNDVVVVRSDGRPLYYLAVMVDDGEMEISHVIRGLDLQSSTPYQIMMHKALGHPIPEYAHIPLIAGPGGRPLGKRFGGDSVEIFRSLGYLPEAMVNYLALLGWGMADQTIISRDELIEKFELEKVHASPANIDPERLDWMNGEYIRQLPTEDLTYRLVPWLVKADLVHEPPSSEEQEKINAIAPLVQTRIERLELAADLVRGIFADPEIDPAAVEKGLKDDYVPELLKKGADRIGALDDWSRDAIEAVLREVQTKMGLKPRKAFVPFYVAVHGSTVGAPIFESIELIGKEKFLRRVDLALSKIG